MSAEPAPIEVLDESAEKKMESAAIVNSKEVKEVEVILAEPKPIEILSNADDKTKVSIKKPVEVCSDHRYVFPSPSSWFKNPISAGREIDGIWAYLSLNTIVIVKPRSKIAETEELQNGHANGTADVSWPEFSLVGIQREKFLSISFCQAAHQDLPIKDVTLVSGCEGGMVSIWNTNEKKLVSSHNIHKGQQVVGVEWSTRNPNLIYSIDDNGKLCVWNVQKSTVQTLNLGKHTPNCIAVSPFEDHIVAIGTKAGYVCIVEALDGGKFLQKMRHDEEVVSLKWVPKGNWRLFSEETSQPLLVSGISSSKGPSIRVWGRDGKDVSFLTPWDKDKDKRSYGSYKSFSIVSFFKDPVTQNLALCTGGKSGEILYWEAGIVPEKLHFLHSSPLIFDAFQFGDILWSFSFEAMIVGWNLRFQKLECVIPTFKGVSSAMVANEHTDIAIGGIDSIIRILKFVPDYPFISSLEVPTLSNRVKGKISAVGWHLQKENRIAFGTDEGVVGYLDIKGGYKNVFMFNRRANGTVYTVCWGPSVDIWGDKKERKAEDGSPISYQKGSDLLIYVCDGKSIYMIHTGDHNNVLINLGKALSKIGFEEKKKMTPDKPTEIQWSPDQTYFAVGYNNGTIELYNAPKLQLRCFINCHSRGIQYMAWRPYDFNPDNESGKKIFATASNDGTTRLFDLNNLFDKALLESTDVPPLKIVSCLTTLQGHGGVRVISLAWSPHDPNLLASVSYDRTAIVWNISTGVGISRYMEHQHRLISVLFHPADPHHLITFSDENSLDFAIHIWDMRKHPFRVGNPKPIVLPTVNKLEKLNEKLIEIKTSKDHKGQKPLSNIEQNGNSHMLSLLTKSTESKKTKKIPSLLPMTANALVNGKHSSLADEIKYLVEKTPLPTDIDAITKNNIEAENSQLELVKLIESLEMTPESQIEDIQSKMDGTRHFDEALHLEVFGNSEACTKIVKAEMDFHLKLKKTEPAFYLSLWLKEPADVIEQAIKDDVVTEMMINVAYRHSKSLWKKAVHSYVNQLKASKEFYKAANYLAEIGEPEEAVNLLADEKFYREAIVLAKLLFTDDLPIIGELQMKWTNYSLLTGNFELAGKILASLGKYDEAVTAIQKRNLPYIWKTAIYLSTKTSNSEDVHKFGFKYAEYLMKGKYHSAVFQLTEQYPSLKWLIPISVIHQKLFNFENEFSGDSVQGVEWEKTIEDFKVDSFAKLLALNVTQEDLLALQENIVQFIQMAIPQTIDEARVLNAKLVTLNLLKEDQANLKELIDNSKNWFLKSKPGFIFGIGRLAKKFGYEEMTVETEEVKSNGVDPTTVTPA